MKSLVVFVLTALIFGAAALGAGYAIWADDALFQGGAAFALAFLPAAGTLAWVVFAYRATPDLRLIASLGGSGLRMAIALGGGYWLANAWPDRFTNAFWSWLALFYLVFLGLEITLLVRAESKLDGSPQA